MRVGMKDTKRIRNQKKTPGISPIPENKGPVPEDDRQTKEFLFKTIHDLKNPLHTIMGYTGLVLRKTRDQIPEIQRENLEKVLQSAQKLNEIVDRMAAFYRGK